MVVGHDLPFVLQPGHLGHGVTGDVAGQVQILREREREGRGIEEENIPTEITHGGRIVQRRWVSDEAVKFRTE